MGFDDRGIPKKSRERRRVEGRRHRHDPQVGARLALDPPRHREGEIAVEVALVEFVEHHDSDLLEERIPWSSLTNIPSVTIRILVFFPARRSKRTW